MFFVFLLIYPCETKPYNRTGSQSHGDGISDGGAQPQHNIGLNPNDWQKNIGGCVVQAISGKNYCYFMTSTLFQRVLRVKPAMTDQSVILNLFQNPLHKGDCGSSPQ
jgi:hypothetical protein